MRLPPVPAGKQNPGPVHVPFRSRSLSLFGGEEVEEEGWGRARGVASISVVKERTCKGKGKAGEEGRSVVRRAHTASGATQAASLCLTLLTRVSTG
jgi:hypothetical protein